MTPFAWVQRRLAAVLLFVLVPFLAWPTGVDAAPAVVTNDMPWDFVAPTADCLGEDVHISGTGHSVFRFDVNEGGRLHVLAIDMFMDVTAVGVDTGTAYNPTGQPAHQIVNLDVTPGSDAAVFQITNRQLFISGGSGDNFILTQVEIFTMTANGVVAVSSEHVSTECRG